MPARGACAKLTHSSEHRSGGQLVALPSPEMPSAPSSASSMHLRSISARMSSCRSRALRSIRAMPPAVSTSLVPTRPRMASAARSRCSETDLSAGCSRTGKSRPASSFGAVRGWVLRHSWKQPPGDAQDPPAEDPLSSTACRPGKPRSISAANSSRSQSVRANSSRFDILVTSERRKFRTCRNQPADVGGALDPSFSQPGQASERTNSVLGAVVT